MTKALAVVLWIILMAGWYAMGVLMFGELPQKFIFVWGFIGAIGAGLLVQVFLDAYRDHHNSTAP